MQKNKSKEEKKMKSPKEPQASSLFGLRNKIYVCFLVPIIFMIIVGSASYYYAAKGMSENFKASSQQTANMTIQYLDTSATYIQSEGMRYAFDSSLETYFLGMPGTSPAQLALVINDFRVLLMASQTSNPFLGNIYIIPKSNMQIITTATTDKKDGIFDDYQADMLALSEDGRNIPRWIDEHPRLDEQLGLSAEDYFISYQQLSSQRFGYVTIDVKKEALEDVLKNIDFGEGSVVGLVTDSGKELFAWGAADGAEKNFQEGVLFSKESFFKESTASEELSGFREVTYQGEDYFFIYNKSQVCNLTLCSLIPHSVMTGQAERIKTITFTLVILAGIVALCVGAFITFGIQRNMKAISQKLNQVADGNLTVSVSARGRDEFQSLATTATNMIQNNKKLVLRMAGTVQQLESTTHDVDGLSTNINDYSKDIAQAIDVISEGMSKQAEHAHECVVKTNMLSEKIHDINTMIERVEAQIDKTEEMIRQGTDIVNVLANRAEETSDMTARVSSSIETLRKESETIDGFVETISNISQQTNLLSLNASIEAARAGTAGRGFAVVAEEIRKLADDSNRAAEEIRNNVANISVQTISSVNSAKEAGSMVALQAQAVDQVIQVFQGISHQMKELFSGLKEIADATELVDEERNDTLDAVENISAIIQETASSSAVVHDMAMKLLDSAEELNQTAQVLDEDTSGLKSEVSVFKLE